MFKWVVGAVAITLAGALRAQSARITAVDRPLLKQYQAAKIIPAKTCSDTTFIRRVYLDSTGTLPTADQVRDFLSTKSSRKRAELIDTLLKSDAFADYTTLRWCDRLRIKSEFPINLWPNAVQAYHRWVLESVRTNKPYDQFVREILTSNGSNFRVPPVNFFRAVQTQDPASFAHATALTFMGCRIEAWPEEQRNNLATFFADLRFNQTGEWKEEIVYADLFRQSSGRSDMRSGGGRHLVNQFLAEMDGTNGSNEGLLILAATNTPWHVDTAFRRPGRFDRVLFVPPPDQEAREEILKLKLREKPVDKINIAPLAKRCPDFSGADLDAVIDLAIEHKLEESIKKGTICNLTEKDLLKAAKKIKPSTKKWFASAKNHAVYANQGGTYDDIVDYLKIK